MAPQETEEEEVQEEQESPRRRRSIQESLALPLPVLYPGGRGQRDEPAESREASRSRAELSSSPSLSPSLGDSVESSGSPPLSSPQDGLSPQSPSGAARNVKKREPKGKAKESRGRGDSRGWRWRGFPLSFYSTWLLFGFRRAQRGVPSREAEETIPRLWVRLRNHLSESESS